MSNFSVDQLLLALLCPQQQPLAQQIALETLSPEEGEALVALAIDQKVAGLVYQALQKFPEGNVPQSVITPLHIASQKAARFNFVIVQELKTILAALNAASIPAIVLKGAYLAKSVYPQLHLRQMADIDLLLPEEQVVKANLILQQYGYFTAPQYADYYQEVAEIRVSQNQAHHLIPISRGAKLPSVELHWNICPADEAYGFTVEELWQKAQPEDFWGQPALVLCPEHLILHICHHAAYHHSFDMGLRGLVDIALIINKFQDCIDWINLEQTAKKWQWQKGVYLTLAVSDKWFELPITESFRAKIKQGIPDNNFLVNTQTLLLQTKAFNRGMTNVFTWKEAYQGRNIPLRIWLLLQRIFPPVPLMAEMYSLGPSYFSLALYRHYWKRLFSYLVYKARATTDQLQARQLWQEIKESQPAIANHKATLHSWLKIN